MIRTYDKEKVLKIISAEEFKHFNAFNIVPNLSDKVIDFVEENYEVIDIIKKNITDKRLYNSVISIPLLIMAGIQSRMKQQFSISELPLAITSNQVIEKLGQNIELEQKECLLKEANIRAILEKYKTKKGEELEFNNDFIKGFNDVTSALLTKVNLLPNVHILDCSILDVNKDNKNYEGSTVTFKGGEHLRGYKIGALRGVTPNGGVIEEICMSTAKNHDLEMSKNMILGSKYLKPKDYLLEDRGFIDIDILKELNKKEVYVIIPAKKNMEIYIAAVNEAKERNKWQKHPNQKRKNQEITLISNLENFWISEKDKNKKPENIKLDYKINATVIRIDKKKDKSLLTDEEIISTDDKYAYIVIMTNDTSLSCSEIVRLYEQRPEIEEDFRQLKDFWGLNTYRSTKYTIISFIIMVSLLGYNFYQIFKESEEGENYIGKNFIVEERKGLYIVKRVRTTIIVDNYFAIFTQDELLDLYVSMSHKNRELLKRCLVL